MYTDGICVCGLRKVDTHILYVVLGYVCRQCLSREAVFNSLPEYHMLPVFSCLSPSVGALQQTQEELSIYRTLLCEWLQHPAVKMSEML